jgi:LAS superfamily LD-carboxypeptidase LdcB
MSLKSLILFFFLGWALCSCQNTDSQLTDRSEATKQPKEKHPSVSSTISREFLLGKFEYSDHNDFVLMDSKWSDKDIYLQREANAAFEKMAEAAQKDGIDLIVVSGTRNFNEQRRIWEKKWMNNPEEDPRKKALEILAFSSMPSTSRHHWGTDIDINSVEEAYFEEGKGKAVYEWLDSHAGDFGFCQVYSNKKVSNRTGYNEEPWHWSYMPLADKFLEAYIQSINYTNITGFEGSELAESLQMIDRYVKGLNPKCSVLRR